MTPSSKQGAGSYLITERRVKGDARVCRCAIRLRSEEDADRIRRAFADGSLKAKPGVRVYTEEREF